MQIIFKCCVKFRYLTWKTLGAETRLARAEDSVAEKMPAVIRGPNPETISITYNIHQYSSDGAMNSKDSSDNTWLKNMLVYDMNFFLFFVLFC